MRAVFIGLIKVYQRTLSYLIGNQCRFHPTCSQYSIEAIERFGTIKGLWLTTKRIMRCQPMCDGGDDPIPDQFRWFQTNKQKEFRE